MDETERGERWCPVCNASRVGCGIRIPNPGPVIDLALLSFGAALVARKDETHVCATCGKPLVRR